MNTSPRAPRPAWLLTAAAALVALSASVPSLLPASAASGWDAAAALAADEKAITDTLSNGETMTITEELNSQNRAYRLKIIGDGNVVVFDPEFVPVWYSNTGARHGTRLTMQRDGNLVLTTDDGVPVWSTDTYTSRGGSATYLKLNNDGSLTLIRGGRVLWGTRPASEGPDMNPTTPPRPTRTTVVPDPTETSTTRPRPTTTTRPRPTTTWPRPTTTRPRPTSSTWVPRPTNTVTTRPRPTTTWPVPTTTRPRPTTTWPVPTTTWPRPTTTVPEPEPTTTWPVPTTSWPRPTTTTVPDPEPTTTTEPEPEPTTTTPQPTTTPPGESSLGTKAARFAKTQVGKGFRAGANGPESWGTLELVRAAWREVGITLPPNMQAIYDRGRKVPYEQRQPGDIIVYGAPISGVHHLALYVGDERLVEARAIAGVQITLVYDTQRMPDVIRPGNDARVLTTSRDTLQFGSLTAF